MTKNNIDELIIAMGNTPKLMPDAKYVVSDEDIVKRIDQQYVANITDRDGRTLLMYASLYERPKIIEWLISKGDDINCSDKMGNTALHFAVQSGSKVTTSLLIKYGANVNAKDSFGNSPIMRCNLVTPHNVFELLIQNDANPYQKNNFGLCAMDIFQTYDEILNILKTTKAGLAVATAELEK